ncbi:helix-turn-helix domain-containing protein [Formosa sp. A9]|uniref:helix-turn-helix domain-containing protein n=1 Tax=Formosa sp. A9 TaxID=3442641 RepID=UPI003EB86F0C
MINSTEFTKRLEKVIEFYGESASSFAEKIGVQRSSISHILSGRNKPSLDFVLKILSAYPEVELYWLLNGKGKFPKTTETVPPSDLFSQPSTKTDTQATAPKKQSDSISKVFTQPTNGKQIERIVIFYSDGSFQNFENSN